MKSYAPKFVIAGHDLANTDDIVQKIVRVTSVFRPDMNWEIISPLKILAENWKLFLPSQYKTNTVRDLTKEILLRDQTMEEMNPGYEMDIVLRAIDQMPDYPRRGVMISGVWRKETIVSLVDRGFQILWLDPLNSLMDHYMFQRFGPIRSDDEKVATEIMNTLRDRPTYGKEKHVFAKPLDEELFILYMVRKILASGEDVDERPVISLDVV